MAKVTYDLSGVEDLPDQQQAPVGTYQGKIEAAEFKPSKSSGNPMIEVRWIVTHSADGTKIKEDYAPIWDYPLLEHDSKFVMGKTKAFLESIGLKLKGTLDTDKIVGKKAQLKLKSDTDQDGDYRPRIGKIMPLGAAPAAEEPEEEPEAEDAEPEEEEGIDLDTLDRDELKALIKEEKLGTLADLVIKRSTTDDQIREIIADKLGGGEEEEEEEPEDDSEPEEEEEPEDGAEAESDDDGYDAMSQADLVKDYKERELDPKPVKGLKGAKLKAKLIELLREDDSASPF